MEKNEQKDERLGKRASDKVTGFKGTVTAVCQYYQGDTSLLISAKATDNKISAEWFNEGRVEVDGQVTDNVVS